MIVERTTPPPKTEPTAPPPPTERKRRSFAWLWLLLIAALGFFGFRYYQKGQQQKDAAAAAQAAKASKRAVPVATEPVRTTDLPIYLRGLGNVTALNTVTVRSRVDGQLMNVYFKEGQLVHNGEVLAEIDPRPFQVQLQQAEGQLARDQAQLNDARLNLSRYQDLWQKKVIAKQQLDTQAAQVSQFEGVIESDKGAINNAKLQMTYARITAPLTGRIGLRLVDPGNIVHANDQNGLIVITQMEPIAVLFTIPADNLQSVLKKLHAGQHLRVDAYDRDDKVKIASGSLLTVDNQIDPTTGTSKLKAVFDNKDGSLFPNQFVNCRLLLDVQHNAVVVSAPAIQRGPQGTYVYLVKPDQTASVRYVTVGTTEGNDVQVEEGLQPGDSVVVDGQDKLQEGMKVITRPNGAPGGRRGRRPTTAGSSDQSGTGQQGAMGNVPPPAGGYGAAPNPGQVNTFGQNAQGNPGVMGGPAGQPRSGQGQWKGGAGGQRGGFGQGQAGGGNGNPAGGQGRHRRDGAGNQQQ